MRPARILIGAIVTMAGLCVAEVLAGNAEYDALVLADDPIFFWTFDEADGNAVNLAEPIPENELIPQGNAFRELHSEIDSGLSLGSAASFDGQNGIPGSLEASRFYAPDLRGDPTPGSNNDSPGYDFIESQLWAIEMWLQVQGDNSIGDADRKNYIIESFNGGDVSNDPGLIYDFNADELEMFGGGRTGPGNESTIEDTDWHHVIFAFYGNDGGFGVADRQDIVIDGEFYINDTPGFSSGFGLKDFSLGATARNLTEAFEGRIDEVAIYDVGTRLLDEGYEIDVQNAEAEEAFEIFVEHLSLTRPDAAIASSLTGDYNDNGQLDSADLDLQAEQIASATPDLGYDLNDDGQVDFADRTIWVNDLKNSWIGDANLDGEFNSSDLVDVFGAGNYEAGVSSTWAEGDWDGNGEFDSGDLVVAFTDGGYETGPRPAAAAVPEPSGFALPLIAFALAATSLSRRPRRS